MPPTLLHVDASPRTDSVSRRLTAAFADEWRRAHPGGRVIRHDLATLDVPHLGADHLAAWFLAPDQRDDHQHGVMGLSDRLAREVLQADTWVLGVPMWNFATPSSFVAWVDHVVRMGLTVAPSASGVPEGRARARAVVATARGGDFRPGSPVAHLDHQEPWIRTILGFLGLDDVTFVHADRQNPGNPEGPAALETALARVRGLAGTDADADAMRAARDRAVAS